jgi:DNA-binding NarL/FixJ family response regulator
MVLRITPWERSALQLLADGKAVTELARDLRVSESEVEDRLIRLFTTIGAADRTEAIAVAVRRGLLTREP